MYNPEYGPKPEITPDQELEWAKQALKEKDWGEVTDCLNQFTIQADEAKLSPEEKNRLKTEFEKIKDDCLANEEMPNNYKKQIERTAQEAEQILK